MEKKPPIEFTEDELYEVNDAIAEVVHRMISKGQTEQEIKHSSLKVMWHAWKKVAIASLGTADTTAFREMEPEIEEAIKNP